MVGVAHRILSAVARGKEGQKGGGGEFYVFMNLSRLRICIDGFFFCDRLLGLGRRRVIVSDCGMGLCGTNREYDIVLYSRSVSFLRRGRAIPLIVLSMISRYHDDHCPFPFPNSVLKGPGMHHVQTVV